MNLILFEEEELPRILGFDDPRIKHIESILALGEGETFSAGILGGKIGEARLVARHESGWELSFVPRSDPPPLHPVILILGCPRPPVARRLLKDMTSMGVGEIRVCATDLNEKSYLTSKLWRDGLWRKALIEGATQAATTILPTVSTHADLHRATEGLPSGSDCLRVALDNGPDAIRWRPSGKEWTETVLAVGPERGWSDRERSLLADRGFAMRLLGRRILRTETACAVGTGLLLSEMGVFNAD